MRELAARLGLLFAGVGCGIAIGSHGGTVAILGLALGLAGLGTYVWHGASTGSEE